MSALATFDVQNLKEAMGRFDAKYSLCPKCFGVSCLPEHFGSGNPNAQPCPTCDGNGWIPKQLSLSL